MLLAVEALFVYAQFDSQDAQDSPLRSGYSICHIVFQCFDRDLSLVFWFQISFSGETLPKFFESLIVL